MPKFIFSCFEIVLHDDNTFELNYGDQNAPIEGDGSVGVHNGEDSYVLSEYSGLQDYDNLNTSAWDWEEQTSAGTQIILPNDDESKAILFEQEDGTEICSAFDEDEIFTRSESQLEAQDADYDYSSVLVGFTMTGCEVGGTTTMHLLFTGSFDPETTVLRKYNSITHQFETVTTLSKSTTTLNDLPALEVTYEITDGGALDQDAEANGTIVDPVGLGVEAVTLSAAGTSELAATGQSSTTLLLVSFSLVTAGMALTVSRRIVRNTR